jgi:minor histocompatibility antigen H13
MLGLGDIVIPGIFISLALRYDFAAHVRRTLKRNPDARPTNEDMYSKPYFLAVLSAYIAGLTTTVIVMHTFKAAQPALLYLSPACSKFLSFPRPSRLALTSALPQSERLRSWALLEGKSISFGSGVTNKTTNLKH